MHASYDEDLFRTTLSEVPPGAYEPTVGTSDCVTDVIVEVLSGQFLIWNMAN